MLKELLKMGKQVVAAGTDTTKLERMFEGKVEPVGFGFTDTKTYEKALGNVDRVFLMRPPHLRKPEDLYPFIDAMKHHNIEKYIEEVGLPYAHVRPGFFMKNLSGAHSVEIREKNKIFIPAGRSKTSFIDAVDIGLATAALLHNPEKYKNTSHTIIGPEALNYFQVAEILSKVTGRKITYAKPGFLKYRGYYIHKRGLDKAYVNVTVALYFMTRMGTAKEVTDGFSKLTGRKPRTLEEFAMDNIKFFK